MIYRLANFLSRKVYSCLPWINYDLYRQDSQLPKSVNIDNCLPVAKQYQSVLLIGATGSFGPYLLKSLVEKSQATVYCLLRSHQEFESTLDYLKAYLEPFKINHLIDWSRVKCLTGNIAEEKLGLNDKDYEFVCKEIDCIYHNAAWTNHIRPYTWVHEQGQADLRQTNTLAVLETLKIASTHKVKAVHFSSTLWAAGKLTCKKHIAESLPSSLKDHQLANLSGYLISKWIAEILIAQAIQRGIPCTVYRLGQITGAFKHPPYVADNDHLALEIKGCIELGYSHKLKIKRSFLPADITASIICDIIFSHESSVHVYNVFNPHTLNWQDIIILLQDKGYPIKLCYFRRWIKRLIAAGEKNSLYPFLAMYKHPKLTYYLTPSIRYIDKAMVENDQFIHAYQKQNKILPDTKSLLNFYVDAFKASGFFPKTPTDK